MQQITVKAEKRMEAGKGAARSLRRQGLLPAVLYGAGDSTPIKLQKRDIAKLMSSHSLEHALLSVELTDNNAQTSHWAILKDYQVDPIRGELLHIDFNEISLEKKIKVTVPINITKEPAGIKLGGILQHVLREVQVECLPTQIPDRIDVDAEGVNIGHSLHVSDIGLKEGVRILADPQAVILTVSAPVVEEAVAAAPAEAVTAEPELVKKKAKEEEPGEEEKSKKESKK
ncbi:MAG: 50S ribosomal protein L25 [Nitrospirae bacterium]|nr:50S ribosomal protein L25 [Nitrospirota bacterium]